jgi:hypothetical protein
MVVNLEHTKLILMRDFQLLGDYQIEPDGTVNVVGNVSHKANQKRLWIRFGSVTGNWSSFYRGLINLDNLPSEIGGRVTVTYYPQMTGLLRLLVAKKGLSLQSTTYRDPTVDRDRQRILAILDRFAGQGEASAFECGAELSAAGYKRHAQW